MNKLERRVDQLVQNLIDKKIQSEYVFSASRSGGAGGQNVNKVNTKVELRFNVECSSILTDEEKKMVKESLGSRVNLNGEVVVTSTQTRSQLKNKTICSSKLTLIIARALIPKVERQETQPSKSSNERRLTEKRQQSELKRGREKIQF